MQKYSRFFEWITNKAGSSQKLSCAYYSFLESETSPMNDPLITKQEDKSMKEFLFYVLKGNNLLRYLSRDNEKIKDKFSHSLLTIYPTTHGNIKVIKDITCFSLLKISSD